MLMLMSSVRASFITPNTHLNLYLVRFACNRLFISSYDNILIIIIIRVRVDNNNNNNNNNIS